MNLSTSILLTLAYSDQFAWPLKKTEIKQRLLKINSAKITSKNFQTAFENLEKLKLISHQDKYYFLFGREKIIGNRFGAQKLAKLKYLEVKKFLKIIKKFSWVKAVFVTGSLAAGAVKPNDDIDFLIITRANRLWLLRPLLVFYLLLIGKVRLRKWHAANSWCLNLWLDETTLALPQNKHNIYSAFEVLQAKLIFQQDEAGDKWLKANAWASKYLNFFPKNNKKFLSPNIPPGGMFTRLNQLAYYLQYLYMWPHLSREKISLHEAYFHPRDTKNKIYTNWRQSLLALKPKTKVLVTGVFDILHSEHINFLRQAKRQGDILLVGLESDIRVRELKGEGRPVNSFLQRKKNLLKLKLASLVFELPENLAQKNAQEKLIATLKPDVLAVSSHTLHQERKRELVEKYGGQLAVVSSQNKLISSTLILAKNMGK